MAKTRRGLSSIARGVKEKFKNALNFGSERRNEVLENLRDEELVDEDIFEEEDDFDMDEEQEREVKPTPISRPVPPIDDDIPEMETGMREFAENIYSRNRVEEMRTMFLLLINGFSRQLKENPVNEEELLEKLEAKKEQLAEFDKEISLIELENQIENIISSTNNILDEVESEFDKLIDYLDEDNYSNINATIMNIENKLGMGSTTPTGFMIAAYHSNLSMLNEALRKYQEISGKTYSAKNNIKYYPENLIRKIYGEIESKIRQAQKEYDELEDTEQVKASSILRMLNQLNYLVNYLPDLLENPNRFEKIKKETDLILDRVHGERKEIPTAPEPTPVPASTPRQEPKPQSTQPPKGGKSNSLFVIMVEQHTRKIYEKIRELVSEFKANDDEFNNLAADFEAQIASVKNIDEETKNQIIDEVQNRYCKKLFDEFGEELYNFVSAYGTVYENYRQKLSKCTYGTPEFEEAYDDLIFVINKMIADGNEIGIKVLFDEEIQTLSIDFATDKIKPFTSQIVSDEVLKAMPKKGSTDEAVKKQEIEAFTQKLNTLLEQYEIAFADAINQLKSTEETDRLDSQVNNIIENDDLFIFLTREEREEIFVKVSDSHKANIYNKYGQEFIEFVLEVLFDEIGKIDFDTINSLEFGTAEFVNEYTKLLNSIITFRSNIFADERADRNIESISFDEETQCMSIKYKNPLMAEYKKQIVSNELLEKMRAAKTRGAAPSNPNPNPIPTPASSNPNPASSNPNPTPAPAAPSGSGSPVSGNRGDLNNADFVTAKENYINHVNELNYLVEMINDLNHRLESQAVHNFIDINTARSITEMEREAKNLDQEMMSLKIELSKERLAIKKQFNIFVLSLPEVKNIKIEEVEFSGNLTTFVNQRDEMIVEAENRIIELDEERKQNPQNAVMVNEEIATLLDYIEAQNSIVGRRLVSECKTNNIDIVETLKERRENKKDIRERLERIKKDEVSPRQDSIQDLEEEYRKELFTILKKELEKKVNDARDNIDLANPSINLSRECNQAMFMLDSNPKYASINTGKIKAEEIKNLDKAYNTVIDTEQIKPIFALIDEINKALDNITVENVKNDDFAQLLDALISTIISRYSMINNLAYNLDVDRNRLEVRFESKVYDFEQDRYVNEGFVKSGTILTDDLRREYENAKISPQAKAVDKDLAVKLGIFIINSCQGVQSISENMLLNTPLIMSGITPEDFENILNYLENIGVINRNNGLITTNMDLVEFMNKMSDKKDIKDEEPAVDVDNAEVKISARQLTFNPQKQVQIASKSSSLIMDGDAVTISLIKNGIRIKYSQELREKLSQLNAKINLVNKENYRSRTSARIDSDTQEITFKDEREIKPEDYKIEVRIPSGDKSNVLFEYDLENVSEELKAHSR